MNIRAKPYHLTILLVTGLLGLVLFTCHPSNAEKKFPTWDDKVFTEVATRHGKKASARLRDVHDFIIEHLNKTAPEQLELVNDYMNSLTWIADADLWKQEDYWATPFETVTTFGGDCEDIAIAKYAVLRLMGIPDEKLAFAYVITAQEERHMVLVYKAAPDNDSHILDNQHQDVVPSQNRTDLVAVYAFQNDGTLFVIKDKGNGDRKLMAKKEDRKFQKWLTAKERAKKNSESYRQFNRGRPLAPDWVAPE